MKRPLETGPGSPPGTAVRTLYSYLVPLVSPSIAQLRNSPGPTVSSSPLGVHSVSPRGRIWIFATVSAWPFLALIRIEFVVGLARNGKSERVGTSGAPLPMRGTPNVAAPATPAKNDRRDYSPFRLFILDLTSIKSERIHPVYPMSTSLLNLIHGIV